MGVVTALLGSIVTFVVGLLVGGVGIYVGARLVVDQGGFEHAVWTAGIAALVWAVVEVLVGVTIGWIPLLGPTVALLLGMVVYLAVINLRYRGNWTEAGAIAVVAWLAAGLVIVVLKPLLPVGGAIGVPFV